MDKHGLHATPEKCKAIMDAPVPKDVTQLRAYLGLLNYYGKFLPGLSGKLPCVTAQVNGQLHSVETSVTEPMLLWETQ